MLIRRGRKLSTFPIEPAVNDLELDRDEHAIKL